MSKEEIAKKIAELKEKEKEVKGEKCQVYSRVVGYLRPVQSWNDGKIAEFKQRKVYNAGNGDKNKELSNSLHKENMSKLETIKDIRNL